MQPVFVLVDSGLNKDEIKFDLEADEEQYCDECDEVLNNNEIFVVVGVCMCVCVCVCVVVVVGGGGGSYKTNV